MEGCVVVDCVVIEGVGVRAVKEVLEWVGVLVWCIGLCCLAGCAAGWSVCSRFRRWLGLRVMFSSGWFMFPGIGLFVASLSFACAGGYCRGGV